MRFSLGKRNIKIFSKTLRFLAKYSDEILMEAQTNLLYLRVANECNSSVVVAKFDESFFTRYIPSEALSQENYIRVSFRPLLNSIRKSKSFADYHFRYNAECNRVIIEIKKENGVEVTHKIIVLDSDDIGEVIVKKHMSDVSCNPIIFNRLQLKSMREMKVHFSNESVLIENFIENEKEDFQTARFHYQVSNAEFKRYNLRDEVTLVFHWPDFYHIADLAHKLHHDVRIQFKSSGKPMVVTIESGTNYNIQLFEVTLSDESIEQKQKNTSVTFKDYAKSFYKERNIEVTCSELDGICSPDIYMTDQNMNISQNIIQNSSISNNKRRSDAIGITERDMDGMIAAATSNQSKKPRIESSTQLNLSQQEQQEMDLVLKEMDMMDVDDDDEAEQQQLSVLTPMRCPYPESQSDLSSRQSYNMKNRSFLWSEMGPTPPLPASSSNSEPPPASPVVASTSISNNNKNYSQASKDSRIEKLKLLKEKFKPEKKTMLTGAYIICSGSDSEEN